jgi:hypothetical protein
VLAAIVVVVVVLRQWLEGLVQLNVSTASSLVSPKSSLLTEQIVVIFNQGH